MLKEIIISNDISGEELLHKMKIKIYDEALDFASFSKCIKALDPSLNTLQVRVLFNEIKNS